ncbi:MAG: long-chain fatty acid--CoA ligase [Candidatus Nanopelagicales bacterium]
MAREVAFPAEIDLPITDTLGSIPASNAQTMPHRPMYALRGESGWSDVTARQFDEQVRAAARGLIGRGIEAGSSVAILAPTRYEWAVVDFALWSISSFAVPIYESSSVEQIQWILTDSRAVAVVVDSESSADRVRSAGVDIPVWVMDDGLLDDLRADGEGVSDEVLAERAAIATPEDPATIVYTSGTTGKPKGCVLTHRNLMFVVRTLVATTRPVVEEPGARTVLFLPLAHVLGRGAQVYCAVGGMQVAHCPSPKLLVGDMATVRPTFLVGVPRIFEKIFNASQQKAHAEGKGRIFERAAQVAIDYGRATRGGGRSSLWLRAQHAVFDRLVYSKLRDAMGGKLRYAITGGASLGERLGFFYAGIGLTVMEGYGLTETTASGTFNRAENPRIGSVGQPMPGTAVRIAEDGEIWLRGPFVMSGYHNNPAETAKVIDADGWFQTGDLGSLDMDGFLRITGRKKEIIVTAGGKNVAPAVLEDRMQAHNLIGATMVVGEAQPFIAALITLDPDALPAWAEAHGKAGRTAADLRDDPDLRVEIQKAVDDANSAVSKAESIRSWRLLDDVFTETSGHLTPTQKLKRNRIAEEYSDQIDAIYG